MQPDRIINQWETKVYLDEYEKEIRNNSQFEKASVTRKNDETIVVITEEKFIFFITENGVEYKGIYDGKEPPTLQEGNVNFKISPEGWTNKDKTVELEPKIEGYDLEYSTDGTEWKKYNAPIIMEKNGNIHVRLVDVLGLTGESYTKLIDKIDKKGPSVTFSTGTIQPNTLTGLQVYMQWSDDESGANSTWKFFPSRSPELGVNNGPYSQTSGSNYPYSISQGYSSPPAGTYYAHMIVSDKAGNITEAVSGPIEVVNVGLGLSKNMVGSDTFDLTASLTGANLGLTIKSLTCGTRKSRRSKRNI